MLSKKCLNLCTTLFITISAFWYSSCSRIVDSNTTTPNKSAQLSLSFANFSTPSRNISQVNLNIQEISISNPDGWIILGAPDTMINFLEVVHGVIFPISDTTIPAGTYDQLRLKLGEGSNVVVNDTTYPLKVPSGQQSGVKININQTVNDGDTVSLYIDFDEKNSLKAKKDYYQMTPTFKAHSSIPPSSQGTLRIHAVHQQSTRTIEKVFLHIKEISISDTTGWKSLASIDTVINFLEFTNGTIFPLVNTALPNGIYEQLRITLGDNNSVVADGQSYPLRIPSGQQSGVKINCNFSLTQGETVTIKVDFDEEQSLKKKKEYYQMRPTFNAIKE